MIYKCPCGHTRYLSAYKGIYYCGTCKQDKIENDEEARKERIAIMEE